MSECCTNIRAVEHTFGVCSRACSLADRVLRYFNLSSPFISSKGFWSTYRDSRFGKSFPISRAKSSLLHSRKERKARLGVEFRSEAGK